MLPTLHVFLLGRFLLLADTTPLTAGHTPRMQALLAYLVLHPQTRPSRQQLAFLLWPDSREAQALTNLRKLVHHWRGILPDLAHYIQIDHQAIGWQAEAPYTLDVADFERAVAQADQAEQTADRIALRAALQQAVAAYQGELLPGCYDEWIFPLRERLHQTFLTTLERLILLLEQEQDYPAAIAAAQRLLREDPLHESAYRYLMRLRLAYDDRAGALHAYHTCAAVLQRELGVEPSPSTRALYERLVANESLAASAPPPAPTRILASTTPLVGRQREWAGLQVAWQTALQGRAHLVLLTGEAGIGKTRLAEELVLWAERQGIATATARCYAAEQELAYAPAVAWLRARPLPMLPLLWRRELGRLLPEVLTDTDPPSAPAVLDLPEARQRLVEALARALLGYQPQVCFLDDLQWCDRETLEWLHYLLRFDPRAQLLVLGTARREEIPPTHPLIAGLDSLRRNGQLTEITVNPLDPAETASLATQLTTRPLPPEEAAWIYQETEGNPLFVVEMMRTRLADQPPHRAPAPRVAMALPPIMQAVLATRLAQLSPTAQELVGLAATIGREFTFPVLARASYSEEQSLMQGLDELWQRRIIQEQRGDRYTFSHHKLCEVAYARLGQARRRVLHRRVAEALAEVHQGQHAISAGEVAAHYEQAGFAADAIPYYAQAAEDALQIYAPDEALRYLCRALALLPTARQSAPDRDWGHVAQRLHEELGDVLELTGRLEDARAQYEQARAAVDVPDAIRAARLQRKIGVTWQTQGQNGVALQAYEEAETALRTGATSEAWWQEWLELQLLRMLLHETEAHVLDLAALIEEVRPVAAQHGTAQQQSRFARRRVGLDLRRTPGVVSDATLRLAQEALQAAEHTAHPREILAARFVFGLVLLWRRDLAAAEVQLQMAHELATRIGDPIAATRCLAYQAILHRLRGQVDSVRELSEQVLTAATTQQLPIYEATARANLAWVAWRTGDLTAADQQGRAALVLWPSTYPVQWVGRWPVLAVALAQDRVAEAVAVARPLLAPDQQHLTDALQDIVAQAVQAWDQNHPDIARQHLQQAVDLARELGYL
jgi:DNA-binding SARP family transcriptional activator